MSRRITFFAICFLLAGNFSFCLQSSELYSKKMADSQMKRSGTISEWDYPNGLFIESILKVYDTYKDEQYYTYALNHAKATVNTAGKIGSKYKFTDFNLDYVNPGMFLLKVYNKENDNRYKIALDTLRKQLSQQPRNSQGGFWHKKSYPNQMWLDGLFMGSRFYALYDTKFDGGQNLDDVINQFVLIHSKTFNTEKQLGYHAWAEDPSNKDAFWANKNEPFKGCSLEFWSRGIGWFFAALVDVLDVIPENHPRRNEMLTILNEVASGIKRWQDKDSGLWYQLTQYDSKTCVNGKCNYFEASSSCMFTYALLKSVRLGFLSKEIYLPVGEKAYNGIITNLISTEKDGTVSLNNICSSAGLGPSSNSSRDGSISYYLTGSDAGKIVSNDLKGVGPFIMASVEYEIIERSTEIKTTNKTDLSLLIHFQHDTNILFIKNKQSVPIFVDIFDISGKKITQASGNADLSVPFSPYAKGMYIVKVNDSIVKKFINY